MTDALNPLSPLSYQALSQRFAPDNRLKALLRWWQITEPNSALALLLEDETAFPLQGEEASVETVLNDLDQISLEDAVELTLLNELPTANLSENSLSRLKQQTLKTLGQQGITEIWQL